jgi:hypothetical protein
MKVEKGLNIDDANIFAQFSADLIVNINLEGCFRLFSTAAIFVQSS